MSQQGTKLKQTNTPDKKPTIRPRPRIPIQLILAFTFGVVFITVLLVLAICIPYPSPLVYLVFRVVLALAAAGIAAMLPGSLGIELNTQLQVTVTATGAIGVFVLVYFFNPVGTVSSPVDPNELVEVGKQLSNSIAINTPQPNDVIATEPYEKMSGTLSSEVPKGYKLWVLAKDSYNYFLMYPPTQTMPVQKSWQQSNVRLSTPGTWQLHLVVANAKGSDWFEARRQRNDWSGFSSLPDGVEIIKSVDVERR